MYLISLPGRRANKPRLVFCRTDPRAAGYTGPVLERAELEMSSLCESSLFGLSSVCVGRHPEQTRRFRVFATADECAAAGFVCVGGSPVVAHCWSEEMREADADANPQKPFSSLAR